MVFLERILERKEEELAGLRRRADELAARASDAPPPRGFVRSLRSEPHVAVIAEFKRRSPSAGALGPGADPARRASLYESAGARAISVLTDAEDFGGSLDDLREARAATRVPVLRKDFVLDPVQVHEARGAGADAVLLIVRILADSQLRELLGSVRSTGMDALVEVHDDEELGRAEAAGARCVGVNARDLSSFGVDLTRSEGLLRRMAGDVVAVAESGIRDEGDVDRVAAAGADAVLVGSALMQGDPESLLRRLSGRRPEAAPSGRGPGGG